MTSFSDEPLSAYVDGEGGADLAAQIEAAASGDAHLAARIEAIRHADGFLRAAFDEATSAVPASISAALNASNVVPLRPRASPTQIWYPAAAAAVLMLAIGLYGGRNWLAPQPMVSTANAGLTASSTLAYALSHTASGARATIDGGTIRVAMSFQASNKQLCREFTANFATAGAQGVACNTSGVWHIEGWAAAPKQNDDSFRTASGPDDSALSPVLNRLGVATPLDRAAEQAAIKSNWKR